MTAADITLVQASFVRLLPDLDRVGVLFYARLLELDPALRRELDGDPMERDRRVVQWLGLAVSCLGHPESLGPLMNRAGRQRSDLLLSPGRLETISVALLWALAAAADEPLAVETRNAWTRTCGFLANLLRAGATDGRTAA